MDASVKDDLVVHLKKEITLAYGKDPSVSNDFPGIINKRNFDRLRKMIAGQTILMGGETDETTLSISPTLIDDPATGSEVMKEEIFGPILPVLSFKIEEDIDRIISEYGKPLAFYIFSGNRNFIRRMIRKYSFGGGTVNDTTVHFADPHLPFGGVGSSGMGAYHGKFSFDTFSHKKGITRRYNWLDLNLRYPPYKGKLNLLKFFMKWLG